MKSFTILFLFIAFACTPIIAQNDTVSIPQGAIQLTPELYGEMCIPFQGKVISKFGPRGSRMHTGTDIKLAKGDTVVSAFDGTVNIAAPHYGYGLLVTVEHAQGITTYYSHLSKILVKKGQTIKAGEVLGLGGSTGRATTTHLHFEVRVNGKPINAQQIFDFENNSFLARHIVSPSQKNSIKTSATEPETQIASAQSTSSETKSHKVQKGDTLYSIAKRYGVTISHICELNNITVRSILSIGQTLLVP
ncbi:LysM domain-containing protein [Breznakibacter xylanolyticus]|uniref:LysM domain-containing protein n=1 Tax=Breznakibacter xylanolyticus TaxID=990 RepID=A0A2W7MWJ8_9BACT|nr:M23 family metallopeptidase [Breznakibacter xylanolyticus]MBN2743878.1 peptidoglycan DD-metalloendopeptidase family protein [Marinilabiliaceae bacterium]PZX12328.1 LysM domain-containing protein [Breznakibacter xylanolyticus]